MPAAVGPRLGLARDLDWLCRRVAVRGARNLPPGSLVLEITEPEAPRDTRRGR